MSIKDNKKFIGIGFLAGVLLLTIYFFLMSWSATFEYGFSQVQDPWILILAFGFGLQAGLFAFIRSTLGKMKRVSATVAATGGISSGSMIVCCLHHATDVLPVLGFAAIAVFLAKYQTFFLVLGASSNIIGISIMLEIMQKNNLLSGFFKKINIPEPKKYIIGFTVILLLAVFAMQWQEGEKDISKEILQEQTLEIDGISVLAKPLDFNLTNPVEFEIGLNTHSGSLDFDLMAVSLLQDSFGNQYKPVSWEGSPLGGHHRLGTLTFPKLENIKSESMRLIISGVSRNKSAVFNWKLQ